MQLHTQKQLKYFDEVIRLHFEDGLGEDSIAMRIPLGHTTIGRWIAAYNSGDIVRPSKSVIVDSAEEIQEMYDSGMSMRAIGRVTGLSKSTICRKIATFASENKEQDMPQKQTETKPMAKDA